MSAMRCSQCSINWPMFKSYVICPECGTKCSAMTHAVPIEIADAKSRKNHADFERYCAVRDSARQAEIDALEQRLTGEAA